MDQPDKTPIDMWREEIERRGTSVMEGNAPCQAWKKEHDNCHGCPDALGCRKLIEVFLLQCESMHYQPRDFEDQHQTFQIVGEKIASIINANNIEEVDTIIGQRGRRG